MILKALSVRGPQDGYIARRIEQAAYLVSERRKESGRRMALGAQRRKSYRQDWNGRSIACFWFDGGMVDPTETAARWGISRIVLVDGIVSQAP
jgi:hypothetical protein